MKAMCFTVLSVVFAVSGVATAAIGGSDHDFSASGWAGGQICLPCHAPHNPDPGGGFLWNHTLATEASLTLYTPASGSPVSLGFASLSCLGCHDGQTALDSFGGAVGGTTMAPGIPANVGLDLTDDHPIGIAYPATTDYKAGHILPLYNDQVECASCHDAHNNGLGTKMLRISNAGSALCIDCHNK